MKKHREIFDRNFGMLDFDAEVALCISEPYNSRALKQDPSCCKCMIGEFVESEEDMLKLLGPPSNRFREYSEDDAPGSGRWVELNDTESSRAYWYHTKTKESTHVCCVARPS